MRATRNQDNLTTDVTGSFHHSIVANDSLLIYNTLRFSCHPHTHLLRRNNRNRHVSNKSSIRVVETNLQLLISNH